MAGVSDPAGAAATVDRLAHERLTPAAMGRLLDRAEAETQHGDPDGDDACLVRVARRDREHEVKLPAALVADMARAKAEAPRAWSEARRTSD